MLRKPSAKLNGARAYLRIMLTDDAQITLGGETEASQYQINPFVSGEKGWSRTAFLLTRSAGIANRGEDCARGANQNGTKLLGRLDGPGQ